MKENTLRKAVVNLINDTENNAPPIELLKTNGWTISFDIGDRVYSCRFNKNVLYANTHLSAVVDYLYNHAPALVINEIESMLKK